MAKVNVSVGSLTNIHQYDDAVSPLFKLLNATTGLPYLTTGHVATANADGTVSFQAPSGGGADEKAKVSSDDTTSDYLVNKVTGSSSITATETTPGGNETLVLTATPGGIDHDSLLNYVAAQHKTHPTTTVDNSLPKHDGTGGNLQSSSSTLSDTEQLSLNNKDAGLRIDNQTQDAIGIDVVPSDHAATRTRGHMSIIDPTGLKSHNPASGQVGHYRAESFLKSIYHMITFNDCFLGDVLRDEWKGASSGAGSLSPILNTSGNNLGVLFDPGTASGGYSRMSLAPSSGTPLPFYMAGSSDHCYIATWIYCDPAVTSSYRTVVMFGLTNDIDGNFYQNNLDQAYFVWEESASSNWFCNAEDGDDNWGAGTSTDSSVVADGWMFLEIHMYSDRVFFYIDKTEVAEITTNTPDTGDAYAPAYCVYNEAASTAYITHFSRFEMIVHKEL